MTMDDCLFCAIAQKRIPSDMVFENAELVVFKDIHPKASTHVLIVPKRHLDSLRGATPDDVALLGRLLYQAKLTAEQLGVDGDGYKVIINSGRHGGQVVDHIHVHLLGGEPIRSIV